MGCGRLFSYLLLVVKEYGLETQQTIAMGNTSTKRKVSEYRNKYWYDGALCFECRKPLKYDSVLGEKGYWQVGHDKSDKYGGTGELDNLNPTCYECNSGMYKKLHAKHRVQLKILENGRLGISPPNMLPEAYYSVYSGSQTDEYSGLLERLRTKVMRKRNLREWKLY
jgi:hypothetical protein